MQFSDESGHIFTLPSSETEPVGYEYARPPYTFWTDTEGASFLSCGRYYIRTVMALFPHTGRAEGRLTVTVTLKDSAVWKLIRPEKVDEAVRALTSPNAMAELPDTALTDTVTQDDMTFLHVTENGQEYLLAPLYFIGNAPEEGSWSAPALISYEDLTDGMKDICAVTVAGQFREASEELSINGANMGVSLPKDIMKAVNGHGFRDAGFDQAAYDDKLREYLICHMDLRGQAGNFDAALKGLGWFDFGDRVTLTRLMRTDNRVKTQYVHDFFRSYTDMPDSFRTFRNSTYVTLREALTKEGDPVPQDFTKDFWGEGKPAITRLDMATAAERKGRDETWEWMRPYFDAVFNDAALKLACLAHHYSEQFLPVHLRVHSASLTEQVWAPDVKMTSLARHTVTETPVHTWTDEAEVSFPSGGEIWMTKQAHLTDSLMNEFTGSDKEHDWYWSEGTACTLPVRFRRYGFPYAVHLILERLHDGPYRYVTDIDGRVDTSGTVTVSPEQGSWSYSVDGKVWSLWHAGQDAMRNALTSASAHTVKPGRLKDGTYYIQYADGCTFTRALDASAETSFTVREDGVTWHVILPSVAGCARNPLAPDELTATFTVRPEAYVRMRGASVPDTMTMDGTALTFRSHADIRPDVAAETSFTICQDASRPETVYSSYVMRGSAKGAPWEDGRFRLRIYTCGRWYEKDFRVRVPVPHIELGTLKYRYWAAADDCTYLDMTGFRDDAYGDSEIMYYVYKNYIYRSEDGHGYVYSLTDGSLLRELPEEDNELGFAVSVMRKASASDDTELADALSCRLASSFPQIRRLEPDRVRFNAHMHEPGLVWQTDAEFFRRMAEVSDAAGIRYISTDTSTFPGTFRRYIQTGMGRVYLTRGLEGRGLWLPDAWAGGPGRLYVYDMGNDIRYIYEAADAPAGSVVAPDRSKYTFYGYDEKTLSYVNSKDGSVCPVIDDIGGEKVSFLASYAAQAELPDSPKYLNRIHVYDIKKVTEKDIDRLPEMLPAAEADYGKLHVSVSGYTVSLSGALGDMTQGFTSQAVTRKVWRGYAETGLDGLPDGRTATGPYAVIAGDGAAEPAGWTIWPSAETFSDDFGRKDRMTEEYIPYGDITGGRVHVPIYGCGYDVWTVTCDADGKFRRLTLDKSTDAMSQEKVDLGTEFFKSGLPADGAAHVRHIQDKGDGVYRVITDNMLYADAYVSYRYSYVIQDGTGWKEVTPDRKALPHTSVKAEYMFVRPVQTRSQVVTSYTYREGYTEETVTVSGAVKSDPLTWDIPVKAGTYTTEALSDGLKALDVRAYIHTTVTGRDGKAAGYDGGFTLDGTERSVTARLALEGTAAVTDGVTVIPHVRLHETVSEEVPYEYAGTDAEALTFTAGGTEYTYGPASDEASVGIYNDFFEQTVTQFLTDSDVSGSTEVNTVIGLCRERPGVTLQGAMDYDLYVMHDNKRWYAVYISRDTEDTAWEPGWLECPEGDMTLTGRDGVTRYILTHRRSDDIFLPNRMYWSKPDDGAVFAKDDIICARLTNNDALPVMSAYAPKWDVRACAPGSTYTCTGSSHEMFTVPCPGGGHEAGYYEVRARYSVDGRRQYVTEPAIYRVTK